MPKTKVKRLILKQFKVATDRLMHIPGLRDCVPPLSLGSQSKYVDFMIKLRSVGKDRDAPLGAIAW
ncbi:hypothetical protein DN752_17110 [Echinicola strongylocentroti]|uniref:Uncharacterized protein n=1 Tax=Echinicola strongylocentroti TaxID=1795355 RepID=A0A2Z4IKS9_9BACT|nr:hypothetical protein DN752_17110 [Echinicola strongylocentroti]